MIRTIFNFILRIRDIFINFAKKGFDKLSDSEDSGKLKGLAPRNWKKVFFIAISIFFLGILMTQLFSGNKTTTSGVDSFQKEMTPKLGVGLQEQNYTSPFGDDALSILNNKQGDPLGALNSGRLREDAQGSGRSGSDDNSTYDEQGNKIPTLSDCLDLIEKLKSGVLMSDADKTAADICLAKNIAGLSASELAAAKALLEKEKAGVAGGKTDSEKELLKRYLNNDLDPDSIEGKIAKGIAEGNPDAKLALGALEAKNNDLADALLKKMDHDQLSPEEQAMIDAYKKLVGQGQQPDANLSEADQLKRLTSGGSSASEEEAKNLARRLADEEQRKRQVEEELAKIREQAKAAGAKLAAGQPLTSEEQALLKKMADLQSQQRQMETLQNQRRAALAKLMNQLQTTLIQLNKAVETVYPTGISVEMDESLVDCSKVKPLFKRVAKSSGKKGPKKPSAEFISLDGEPLSPDKIRLVKLMRKEKSDFDKARQNVIDPLGSLAGDKFLGGDTKNLANESTGEEGVIDINSLRIYSDKSLKPFNLTPDMKIAAVLDSEILVSSKQGNQMVRVRILQDVINPENNQLVIPKGSIAIGTTGGFDVDTGTMDLSFDKVTVGSGKVLTVKMKVGSANGMMGLRGQVRDTRGKYLLGAFVTSFSAGALNWFSQSVITPFQTSTNDGEALTGAALAGGAEVMNKIAEMYAGDLQSAAKIYYCPKGIPLVLFPE